MEFLFSQLFALCLLFENQLFHMQFAILICFPSLTFFVPPLSGECSYEFIFFYCVMVSGVWSQGIWNEVNREKYVFYFTLKVLVKYSHHLFPYISITW